MIQVWQKHYHLNHCFPTYTKWFWDGTRWIICLVSDKASAMALSIMNVAGQGQTDTILNKRTGVVDSVDGGLSCENTDTIPSSLDPLLASPQPTQQKCQRYISSLLNKSQIMELNNSIYWRSRFLLRISIIVALNGDALISSCTRVFDVSLIKYYLIRGSVPSMETDERSISDKGNALTCSHFKASNSKVWL